MGSYSMFSDKFIILPWCVEIDVCKLVYPFLCLFQYSSKSGIKVVNYSIYSEADLTAQKIKFSIKDFFSKYDQIRTKLRIWLNLLKKSLTENFIFCAVSRTAATCNIEHFVIRWSTLLSQRAPSWMMQQSYIRLSNYIIQKLDLSNCYSGKGNCSK